MDIKYKIDSPALYIEAFSPPWDNEALNQKVIHIDKITERNPNKSILELKNFIAALAANKTALITCKLPHTAFAESLLLQALNFKFIEMSLHPFKDKLLHRKIVDSSSIKIKKANNSEINELSKIAETAFSHERFHADSRIPDELGQKRYKNWVLNCKSHPTQEILQLCHKDVPVGFFIIEEKNINNRKIAYWHLTAISSQFHGQGLGTKCWNAMLNYHQSNLVNEISTRISTRNTRVLNLYSKLNFRFRNPEMSFHWVNTDVFPYNDNLIK